MAGVYIHIPFCKKLCNYCDFHKDLLKGTGEEMMMAFATEAELQKDYLEGEEVETIYLGGGTPSILHPGKVHQLIEIISGLFKVSANAEITIETNPDDLNREYLRGLKKTPVNRLSIGIQSFSDEELKLLNRRHNAEQAKQCVEQARSLGFDNISIDLMYGIPESDIRRWERQIIKATDLRVQHISAYQLTVEAGTLIEAMINQGKIKLPGEEESLEQYSILIEKLEEHGFTQYEISNFCCDNFFSIHNANYWKQIKYLGLGPSAHSFNGRSRQWNVADNEKYIQAITGGRIPFTREYLDQRTLYNDYVLTSLRTMWGIDLKYVEESFSKETRDYCINVSSRFVEYGMIAKNGENLMLTKQGKFISDNIIRELIMAD